MDKWEESTPSFSLRLESRVDEAGGMEGDQFVTAGTIMSSYKLLKLKKKRFVYWLYPYGPWCWWNPLHFREPEELERSLKNLL